MFDIDPRCHGSCVKMINEGVKTGEILISWIHTNLATYIMQLKKKIHIGVTK